jgi:hypothetical protein
MELEARRQVAKPARERVVREPPAEAAAELEAQRREAKPARERVVRERAPALAQGQVA